MRQRVREVQPRIGSVHGGWEISSLCREIPTNGSKYARLDPKNDEIPVLRPTNGFFPLETAENRRQTVQQAGNGREKPIGGFFKAEKTQKWV